MSIFCPSPLLELVPDNVQFVILTFSPNSWDYILRGTGGMSVFLASEGAHVAALPQWMVAGKRFYFKVCVSSIWLQPHRSETCLLYCELVWNLPFEAQKGEHGNGNKSYRGKTFVQQVSLPPSFLLCAFCIACRHESWWSETNDAR